MKGKHVKPLFWIWLLLLILLNIIPIGNEANQSLSGNKIFEIRLDYFTHALMILCFAWIWVLGKIIKVQWFARYEAVKYSLIVLYAGVILELLQLIVPWRSFNPVDMAYNFIGAGLVLLFVVLSA
jgi:VanZ family protein